MEKPETVFFLINLKLIMKHGMQHLKNYSQLNIMLGIHNAHFAVENLLREQAKDHIFDASLSGTGFEAIIKKVNKDTNIPQFEDLLRLNTARNSIQHKFIYPHFDTATELVTVAENFLRWGYKMYFEEDYDSLKLEDMIYDAKIKQVMLDSKTAINEGDFKEAAWKMTEGLAVLKFHWFGYLSDYRLRGINIARNVNLPNLLSDLALKIILAEDQYTLNKLLQIRSLWIPQDGDYVPASNYEFHEFKDKEEALAEYDDILNIILNYQDKVPFWKEEEPTSSVTALQSDTKPL